MHPGVLFIPTAQIFGRKDGTKHSSTKKHLHNYRIVVRTVLEYLGIKIAKKCFYQAVPEYRLPDYTYVGNYARSLDVKMA